MAKLKSGSRVYGSLQVDGTFLDTSGDAGSSGQVLSSTGSGTNWVTAAGGGISNVVEDTSPQLGGNLDLNGFHILIDDNDYLQFGNGSDVRMYYSSGNDAFILELDANNNNNADYFRILDDTTERFSFQRSNGDFWADGDVTANTTSFPSDERLKDDIKVIDNALEKVQQIRGVTFVRTDKDHNRRETGVIAQEIEKVLPEAVKETPDGYKAVAYANTVGLLIEAIKEQQEQINILKEEIERLKK